MKPRAMKGQETWSAGLLVKGRKRAGSLPISSHIYFRDIMDNIKVDIVIAFVKNTQGQERNLI